MGKLNGLSRVATALALIGLLTGAIYMVKPAKADVENLTGTLFFHRYTDYGSWDATMWSLDLKSGAFNQINANWTNVISPINAHVSSDGQFLTMMGSASGLPAINGDAQHDWDVFISRWEGSKWSDPINLTGPNGKRDEDPKFSPDSKTIVYKEDGVLATVARTGGAKTYLSIGEAESSMPYYRSNGTEILFERQGKIYLKTKSGDREMDPGIAGISSYYPIGVDDERFLFTRVQDSQHDGIRWGYYDGRPSEDLFFNNDVWDSSDSYPYEDANEFIFLVTGDVSIPKGGYNLVIADLHAEKVVNIDDLYGEINSHEQELGPAWTQYSYQK
ncbi:MAG: hypothetical protein K9F92_00100 [Candidatus Nanopelagicaceae bacterium]|nr:hypothetical protein [Candidatus Nanopelagicaceae bacterium]